MATYWDADSYIAQNVIDIEDWNDADTAKKERIVNVALRTLQNSYPSYTIPDNAVYEFCAVLAIAFNDTNRMQQQGLSAMTIQGVASFNFKVDSVSPLANDNDLARFIPKSAIKIIASDPNNATLPAIGGRVKWSVM
jgi:hypothetical protein